jgi:hypothetical protein
MYNTFQIRSSFMNSGMKGITSTIDSICCTTRIDNIPYKEKNNKIRLKILEQLSYSATLNMFRIDAIVGIDSTIFNIMK